MTSEKRLQEDERNVSAPETKRSALDGFEVQQVLSESEVTKSTAVLGRFPGKDGQAVVLLSRRHLPTTCQGCSELIASLHTAEVFNNDVYAKYAGTPCESEAINVDTIFPATEKHISKHSRQVFHIVEETAELYESVTKPYIDSLSAAGIAWVYNILDRKKEYDRLILEDPDPETGFMLHPDLKWDQSQEEKLYCLAIVHRRDLKSMRDLRKQHVALLQNVLTKGTAAIQEKFKVRSGMLRVYLHYFPSYYHLHVHFAHMNLDPTRGMAAGKAHMVTDVIANLEICDNYYARTSLSCAVGEKDPLFVKFAENLGYI